ncbi:unnamed protein product [Cuscuta epithymum]|uniref:Glutaredoxin domain-containing protein n=1 Tax=Cuscuta epithymum TaxID=186058 RepID=A0AAV0GFE3_9ASTE|nr:unnamed protein product [Cuscuta epithymum]
MAEMVNDLANEHPVVLFRKDEECCQCESIISLVQGNYGASLQIYNLDEQEEGDAMKEHLQSLGQLPAVYMGGNHLGSTEELLSMSITGTLKPTLLQVGAIFL